MRQQSGFTLIELVVVIVILGILAAFAVPRFVGMQEQARISTLKGIKGSLQGAAALGHGKALAQQKDSGETITVGGTQIGMTYHYPDTIGIQRMLQDTSGFSVGVTGANTVVFEAEGAAGTCRALYEQASGDTAPQVTLDTDTCN